jgi:hypothetical protein
VIGRPLLLIAACPLLVGCGEEARISAEARLDSPLTVDMLSVTVRDRDRVWTWQASHFRSTTQRPTPSTPEVETRTSGSLEVSFRLEVPGQTLSEGTVTLPLRSDWRWGVTVMAATTDPQAECFGCFGSSAFPLAEAYRTPQRDSIWVVWGGNSISDPAIY